MSTDDSFTSCSSFIDITEVVDDEVVSDIASISREGMILEYFLYCGLRIIRRLDCIYISHCMVYHDTTLAIMVTV